MVKYEHKHLVPLHQLDNLRKALKPYVNLDRYADRNSVKEYTVRSIYFDTKDLDFYNQKLDGLNLRKKIRVRGYDHVIEDATVFLEIKKKKGYFIDKRRSPVEYKSLIPLLSSGDIKTHICPSDVNTDATVNAERFLFHVHHLALKPYILIIYEREAYYSKCHYNLRITIDKNIRSQYHASLQTLFENGFNISILPKHCILEIKSEIQYPSWLSQVLGRFHLRQEALSKYAMCIDSHRSRKPNLNIISNYHFRMNN